MPAYLHPRGAPSVMSYVKINYKPDGVWTIEKKVKKHHE